MSAVNENLQTARLKSLKGEALNTDEKRSLRKFEREEESRLREKHYAEVPRGDYIRMSGKSRQTLENHATKYGLSVFAGPDVDLGKVLRELHDIVGQFSRKGYKGSDDPMDAPGNSPALEEYRQERAINERIKRLKNEGSLVPVDVIHEFMNRTSALLRECMGTLVEQHGQEAGDVVETMLVDLDKYIDTLVDEKMEEGNLNGGSSS